jgi:hypothetical protein
VLFEHRPEGERRGDRIVLVQAPGEQQPVHLELHAAGLGADGEDAITITDGSIARALAYYLNAYADWHELWTIDQRPDTDPEKRRLRALMEGPPA